MIKFKIISSLILLILITNCGYKTINLNENFKITEVNTKGDKSINFKLKTRLIDISKDEKKNSIRLFLNTKKRRTIGEKNIKNQITKYNILIKTDVEYFYGDQNLKGTFTISRSADYESFAIYSNTLDAEKETIDNLIIEIARQIKFELLNKFNDL
tara:strand:- start:46 stop:513 length:468 start_codon:yes stop_codon:yes gene_type:complete